MSVEEKAIVCGSVDVRRGIIDRDTKIDESSNISQSPNASKRPQNRDISSKTPNILQQLNSNTSKLDESPKNSILIHILLFFLTVGIGNIVYYLYIKKKQKMGRKTTYEHLMFYVFWWDILFWGFISV